MRRLHNGAFELERAFHRVLAVTESGEYVTWAVDDEGNCYWGHYFGTGVKALIDAAEDHERRILESNHDD